ncbi:MAG: NAD(P)H-hydrate dehydratase [Cyanobacteria bacterium J083]|nr:MAG: NAD(P)H-hydrate dehydratase [Cyanobacteria bacterium J083]
MQQLDPTVSSKFNQRTGSAASFDGKRICDSIVVTAAQMREIESKMFAAGMPVAALMEKAAVFTANRLKNLYPINLYPKVGILSGCGHNGADALVIARELALSGYQIKVCQPLTQLKTLTAEHGKYAKYLGIEFRSEIAFLADCDLLIDGLFGFGLTREITGVLAQIIDQINQTSIPVVSVDLPSGIQTDTGEVLGVAVKATQTICLGLWKLAFFQDRALEYLGKIERIDLAVPPLTIQEILGEQPPLQIITLDFALKNLPLPRPKVTHKYQQGNLLLICGSRTYAGAAILAAIGARAMGIGMLSIAVPETIKPLVLHHLPESLVIACPETESGAIEFLPLDKSNLARFTAIGFGCGLTRENPSLLDTILPLDLPLILDADGLNLLAQTQKIKTIVERSQPTILTPHLGEFKRLFPQIETNNRLEMVQTAAKNSQAIVLLKGARTMIAEPSGKTWIVGDSTPALARGGSGDVLMGMISGLLAQTKNLQVNIALERVAIAACLQAEAGILAAREHTELGVDPLTLSQFVSQVIKGANQS